jgi:hypothetical protein
VCGGFPSDFKASAKITRQSFTYKQGALLDGQYTPRALQLKDGDKIIVKVRRVACYTSVMRDSTDTHINHRWPVVQR